MKKSLLLLALILFGSCSVIALYFITLSKSKNGFSRSLLIASLPPLDTVQFSASDYYFAGWKDHHVYLGRTQVPLQLLEVSRQGTKTIIIASSPLTDSVTHSNITVLDTCFVLTDVNRFRVFAGSSKTWKVVGEVYKGKMFAEVLPLSSSSMVLKGFDSSQTKYNFFKIKRQLPTDIALILDQDINGIFSGDGMLRMDRKTNTIVYALFYSNRIYTVDTLLQLKSRFHTIDTVRHPTIEMGFVKSDHYYTYKSPPKIINRSWYAGDGKLYVNSNLKADNEPIENFRSADVIDVYALPQGNYVHSYYIKNMDDQHIRQFIVVNDKLYTLVANQLIIYRLP